MKFSLVNGQKVEPYPKMKGVCPHCNSEMISKCGKVKVWHWAHRNISHCDPWWESETKWHREWKSHFPSEWQEVSQIDLKTGEKHIADVKNPFDLVIEFQHSPLNDQERISRENFYNQMVWVIDGCRNKLDKGHFEMGLSEPIQDNPLIFKINWYSQSRLLHYWGKSQVKVFIDFGENILWNLVLYDDNRRIGAVAPLTKKAFINDCLKGVDISVINLSDEDKLR